MTEWSNRRHVGDLEWRMERAEAETMACTELGCEAPAGEPCVNLDNGEGLSHFPAHWRRIKAAGETPREPPGDEHPPVGHEPPP
jgi:hypothetical protein